ncbi:MAG: hypothetical protein WD995_09340 [Gemmatimonadota bacterium]
MSAFLPAKGQGLPTDPDHPQLLERTLDREERRFRWAVRAAQWRARELAEIVFGGVGESTLRSARAEGPARGLLVLRVPFEDLQAHQAREQRFMAAAASDPVLAQIPLVYVFGPDDG